MKIKKLRAVFNFKMILAAIAFLAVAGTVSCDSVNENEPVQPKMHTCRLILKAEKPDYANTRAESSTWKEGEKIYLRFVVGSNITSGMAVYKSGSWTVNFYGNLQEGTDLGCGAIYFEKPGTVTDNDVALADSTMVYEAPNSVYTYNGSELTVTASLTPKSGRLRFKGTAGEKIEVKGVCRNVSYSILANAYTTSSEATTLTVGKDGYTPYIYGSHEDSSAPYLAIETSDAFYLRDFTKSILSPGESGYMNIPTKESRNGWLYNERKEVKVKGVTIPLMKVVNTDGSVFYLMQTELTNEQYYAITSQSATIIKGNPASQTYNDFSSMITTLNQVTDMKFRFPSKEEWIFASKGGLNTRGYTYSGSNTLSRVAWCSQNASGKLHVGKQLRPNELGFYDMNGNIAEFVEIINDGYYYLYYMGGAYDSSISGYSDGLYYNSSYYTSIDYCKSSYSKGIRLALEL